jgi:hypothetical protein
MLPIPIPTGRSYTATAAGRACKIVPCENCGVEYFYVLEVSAAAVGTESFFFGNGDAKERAVTDAEAAVRRALKDAFQIVPCPHCGHYQSYMTPTPREAHLAWLRTLGIVLVILALVFFLAYFLMSLSASYTAEVLLKMRICLVMTIVVGISAVAVLASKFIRTRRYDPNNAAELDNRLRYARSVCITWEVFEKLGEAALEQAVEQMKSSNELPEFLRRKKA